MSLPVVQVGDIEIGNSLPFVLMGGMNVLESRDMALRIAEHYVGVCQRLGIPYIFKAYAWFPIFLLLIQHCISDGEATLILKYKWKFFETSK